MKCRCGEEELVEGSGVYYLHSEGKSHSKEICIFNIVKPGIHSYGGVDSRDFGHPLNVPDEFRFSNVAETDPDALRKQMKESIKRSMKDIQSACDNQPSTYGFRFTNNTAVPAGTFPVAKYTEEDLSMARSRARSEGYSEGFKDGQSTKRYLCQAGTDDYNATKAHVEKSSEYWADGLDPDEP
jgi:hypothetical protein